MSHRNSDLGIPRLQKSAKVVLEKAQHGMGMPYDAERVSQLRSMLREARKRKLSDGLKARRKQR